MHCVHFAFCLLTRQQERLAKKERAELDDEDSYKMFLDQQIAAAREAAAAADDEPVRCVVVVVVCCCCCLFAVVVVGCFSISCVRYLCCIRVMFCPCISFLVCVCGVCVCDRRHRAGVTIGRRAQIAFSLSAKSHNPQRTVAPRPVQTDLTRQCGGCRGGGGVN